MLLEDVIEALNSDIAQIERARRPNPHVVTPRERMTQFLKDQKLPKCSSLKRPVSIPRRPRNLTSMSFFKTQPMLINAKEKR